MELNDIIALLTKLSYEERIKIFENFCRECTTPIKELDWAYRNFCTSCSPDIHED